MTRRDELVRRADRLVHRTLVALDELLHLDPAAAHALAGGMLLSLGMRLDVFEEVADLLGVDAAALLEGDVVVKLPD